MASCHLQELHPWQNLPSSFAPFSTELTESIYCRQGINQSNAICAMESNFWETVRIVMPCRIQPACGSIGGQLNPRKEIYASRNRLRAHKHHQTEVVSSQSSPQ